ncbi:hypothetical protein Bca101_019810 [Brassica carinata]
MTVFKPMFVPTKVVAVEKQGGSIRRPVWFFRFEPFPYLDAFDNISSPPRSSRVLQESQPPTTPPPPALPSPPVSPPPLEAPTQDRKTISTGIIVAIIVSALILMALLALGLVVLKRRRQSYKTLKLETDDDITGLQSLQFDFKTIEVTTDKFSRNNKVGEGGFGDVYKGTLPNGTIVAVKRLSKNSGQGKQEFKNEVVLMAKLQHRNLVRLLDFCLEADEQILVYEFVPNKSLDYFLFDPIKRGQLDWARRYNIIGGLARRILYLHQDSRLTIIYHDVKASNILLDDDMNPNIVDFGMARIFGLEQPRANTSKIAGTFGYMAPEYAMHGQFSMKSDVYSVGSDEVTRCIHIALLCVQEDPEDYPMMSTVILFLTSNTITMQGPRAPGFFSQCIRDQDSEAEGSNSFGKPIHCSINDASITELEAR